MGKEKIIVFDASTLINLSMNGLLDILRKLKQKGNARFIITQKVKEECIDRPARIKKYELGSLQIKQLLLEGVLEMPESIRLRGEVIAQETHKLLNIANHTFFAEGKWMDPIDEGEISCLAVADMLGKKNVVVAMDERTTRMLCEKPENLKKLYEKKFHTRVDVKSDNFKFFSDFKIIRSSEIVFVAYEKGLLPFQDPSALDAVLFATKFKGASISYNEIDEMKRMGKGK